MNFWLMKSEPSVYSIEELAKDRRTFWDGVRNYQARNFMRDKMVPGDRVLFYHSNAEPSGVAGVAQVAKAAYPDFTAWDKKDKHFDPASTKKNPIWFMIEVAFVEKFKFFVPLDVIKAHAKLRGILVAQKGSRLSVQPVSSEHFKVLVQLGRKGWRC